MSRDIYQILESLDAAQKSVKQLPALFRPKDTSPQLSGPYPGKNATLGYLVGESEKDVNPMRQAVTSRIMNRHPEWIMRYGVEALMQAIDDVTEGEEDWEEIGTSDVSAYVRQVYAQLEDRMGSREEMADREPFSEENINEGITSEDVLDQVKKSFADYLNTVRDEVKKDSDLKDKKKGDDDIKAKDGQDRDLVKKEKVKEDPTEEDPVVQMPTHPVEDPTYAECATIKTIALEDGRTCEIYGDEQQGFGIRHGGRSLKSRFRDLDQAQLAREM